MHLINDLGSGGAQKVVLSLVREIDRQSFYPVVGIWGSKFGHELIEPLRQSNVEFVDFQGRSKFDLRSFINIIRYLEKNPVDILHTHLLFMHVIGRIAGKFANVPWIVSTHHNLFQSNNFFLRILEKLTSPLSNVTTSVSRAAQETYFSTSELFSTDALISGRRHFTIYNSVDADGIQEKVRSVNIQQKRCELGLNNKFVFTCIGRLHASKGHKYLINAVEHLQHTHSYFRLLIVGNGSLKKNLLEQVASKGLHKQIYFLGYREDVHSILAASNALVQPSISEGFGIASAEAMACGLPVISTNLPSIAEVVEHQKTGLLVPPADSNALSQAMSFLLDNPDLAIVYGASGKKRVQETFSSRETIQQYEALYQSLGNSYEGTAKSIL